MDYLWAPWRYTYVTKMDEPVSCVFCAKLAPEDDAANLVVHRARHNLVVLNLFPYTSGHMMVIPYRHVATLEELDDQALAEMMLLARDAVRHLRAIYHPEGINLGVNMGRCAGAGVAEHVHMHVLPRWTGDSSFMTTVGETRVIPEDLATTWDKLSRAFRGA
jgi:ATP adenylyltransferase